MKYLIDKKTWIRLIILCVVLFALAALSIARTPTIGAAISWEVQRLRLGSRSVLVTSRAISNRSDSLARIRTDVLFTPSSAVAIAQTGQLTTTRQGIAVI